jgi:hypothetical protein
LELPLFIAAGNCTKYLYPSIPFMNKCVPSSPIPIDFNNSTAGSNSAQGMLTAGQNSLMSAIADVQSGWKVLAYAAGFSVLLSFIWLVLLQLIAGPMVWITIILCNLIMISGSLWIYLFWQSQSLKYYNNLNGTNTTLSGIMAIANGVASVDIRTSLLTKDEVTYISV